MSVTLAVRKSIPLWPVVSLPTANPQMYILTETRYLAKACYKRVSYGRDRTLLVQFYMNFIIQSPKIFMPTVKPSILEYVTLIMSSLFFILSELQLFLRFSTLLITVSNSVYIVEVLRLTSPPRRQHQSPF